MRVVGLIARGGCAGKNALVTLVADAFLPGIWHFRVERSAGSTVAVAVNDVLNGGGGAAIFAGDNCSADRFLIGLELGRWREIMYHGRCCLVLELHRVKERKGSHFGSSLRLALVLH